MITETRYLMLLHLIVFPVLRFLGHDFWSLSGEISGNTRISGWPHHISSSWLSITANRCSFVINIFFINPKTHWIDISKLSGTGWYQNKESFSVTVWHTRNTILQVDAWYLVILHSNILVDILRALIEVLRGFVSLLTNNRIISQSRTLFFLSIHFMSLFSFCNHPVTSKRRS
jgi:hypothetical protein